MGTRAITTGSCDTQDEAIEWLKAHGAKVDSCQAVTVIILPESARVEKGAHDWEHYISFYDAEGNYEDTCVSIELNVDAYETVVKLINGE